MKKKELLNRFGDRYTTIEHDGGYLLYDKEGKARRAQQLFKGHFYLSTNGNKYVFKEEYYETPEELIRSMDQWADTLPFSVELYNPVFKKSYFIECAVHDYLESLGFEYTERMKYVLRGSDGKELCIMELEVDDNTSCGTVTRHIDYRRWADAKFTDIDSAIGACNTLLATYCLSVNVVATKVLSKMTGSRISEFFNHTFDMKTLSTYTSDARRKAIELMEAELKRLKDDV